MTSPIPLHPRPSQSTTQPSSNNPLPTLLQTPSGLALLELQGTINLPPASETSRTTPDSINRVPIGRLHFPDYHPSTTAPGDTSWMKRAWLYVGEHQRLQGEVKKLPKALGVLRRRAGAGAQGQGVQGRDGKEEGEGAKEGELEVVEVVKYKIVFSQRPEPVGGRDGNGTDGA